MFINIFKKTKKYKPPKRRKRFGERLLDGFLRVLIALGILGLACLIGGFIWSFQHFLYHSDYFNIKDIAISPRMSAPRLGETPASPEDEDFESVRDEIEQTLRQEGLTEGNLLSLDAKAVQRAAESHGKVRQATVRKRYPSLLEIDLVLRRTVALLPLRDAILAVDREGVLLEENLTTRESKTSRFPYITGLDLEKGKLGARLESRSLTKTLDLLSLLRVGAPALARKTSEVHCDDSGNLTLLLEGGTEIRFGKEKPHERMPILETFVQKMGQPDQFAYVDLWVDGQVFYKRKTTTSK